MFCASFAEHVQEKFARKNDYGMLEAVYCDKVYISLSETLQSYVHERVRPLCATPELEFWAACPASYEEGVSRGSTVVVGDYVMYD